jgi:tetratricopeptide (TPR) repeat protein
MTDRPKQAPRDEHLGDTRNIVRAGAWVLVPFTALGFLLFLLGSGLGLLVLTVCLLAWAVFAGYLLLNRVVIETIGSAVGRLLLPSGSSTPPAKGLSHIEAMEARGEVAKAAEAYRAEIASDPGDVTSCERLALLAVRRLNDYETALWAYREAERRADSPARKFGYGLLAAGVCRDQLKDLRRAVVELRRLVHQYPTAPRIDALKQEIAELKVAMLEAPDA